MGTNVKLEIMAKIEVLEEVKDSIKNRSSDSKAYNSCLNSIVRSLSAKIGNLKKLK